MLQVRRGLPGLIILGLMLTLPASSAEADPRIHADAKDCLDALEIDLATSIDPVATCVVHYAHVADLFFPRLNTQRPPDDIPFTLHDRYGMSPTISPLWDSRLVTFAFEGGGVEYHAGEVHAHTLPLTRPVQIADGADAFLRLHLSADQTMQPEATGSDTLDAGIIPCVHVEVHVTAQGARSDAPIMLGTGHATGHLARPAAPLPELACADPDHYQIDDQGITTFDIPVRLPSELPAERLNVHVDVYQRNETGVHMAVPGVRLAQGPDHLNHLVLPVKDALTVDAIWTAWHEDRLYVGANITSAFGMYDVDPDALRMEVRDAEGTVVPDIIHALAEEVVRISYCHDCQGDPVKVVFAVDLLGAGLADGTYEIRVIANNLQQTAQTAGHTTFELHKDGAALILHDTRSNVTERYLLREAADSPLPPFAPLVLAMLALVHARRRSSAPPRDPPPVHNH